MNDLQLPTKVKKLNVLIHAKYNTTREQDLIINHSLDHLQQDGNQMTAVMSGNELAYILNINDKHNLSRALKTAAQSLIGNTIIIDGPNDEFEIFGIVTNASYSNSLFSITYNKRMTPYISNVTSNYTILDRAMESTFTTKYAIKMYELLKSEIFKIGKTGREYIELQYGFNELKCLLSLVNLEKTYIQDAIAKKVSWDDLVEKIAKPEDKKYNRVSEFKRYVLIPAMEEINEKSDIHFDFTDTRGGRGKIKGFTIRLTKARAYDGDTEVPPEIIANIEKLATVNDLESIINKIQIEPRIPARQKAELVSLIAAYGEAREELKRTGVKELVPFTVSYFKKLWKKSGKNLQNIKDEIHYAAKVQNINNYYGYLMSAVEKRFSKISEVETIEGSTEDAKVYRNIRNDLNKRKIAYMDQQADIAENDDRAQDAILNEQIWENLKQTPNYPAFILYSGMDEETFEDSYSAIAKIKIFTDYCQTTKK